MNNGYKFKDPAFAEGVERHRSVLDNLEATLTDLAVARMGLEETINSCDDPATRGKLMKDSVQLAAMVTKVSKEIIDLQFRMNELLSKEALHLLRETMVELLSTIVREEVGDRAHEKIVDRLAPALMAAIEQAEN